MGNKTTSLEDAIKTAEDLAQASGETIGKLIAYKTKAKTGGGLGMFQPNPSSNPTDIEQAERAADALKVLQDDVGQIGEAYQNSHKLDLQQSTAPQSSTGFRTSSGEPTNGSS